MKKINLTYEQILEKLEEKGTWNKETLYETFGKECVSYIQDIEEMFPMYFGMLILSSVSGFILFPLDEYRYVEQSQVKKMDVDWAKQLENAIIQYENHQKELIESIDIMKKLVKSQRIKTIFE